MPRNSRQSIERAHVNAATLDDFRNGSPHVDEREEVGVGKDLREHLEDLFPSSHSREPIVDERDSHRTVPLEALTTGRPPGSLDPSKNAILRLTPPDKLGTLARSPSRKAWVRILLDARTVGREFSGVGNYVMELTRAFAALDEDVRFELFVMSDSRLRDLSLDERFSFHVAPFSHESHPLGDLWEHLILPRMADRLGCDVLHGPAFLIPTRRTRVAKVVTVHDLVAFTHPRTIPRKYAVYMRWLIRRAVHYSERVIAISQSVRHNIERTFGSQPHVDVIHSGVASRFHVRPEDEVRRVRARYGIDERYLLFVGNLEPRKNLPGLLRAFREVRRTLKEPLQLVIAGKLAWLSEPLLRELESEDLRTSVLATGYVDDDDLPALYTGAAAFVFPTFWEGFGLPVLEAMACGTPVVASDLSSLPEVAGDAAILVDPHSLPSITNGILEALNPERSRDLSQRGSARVEHFRWTSTAQRTLEAYARARVSPS